MKYLWFYNHKWLGRLARIFHFMTCVIFLIQMPMKVMWKTKCLNNDSHQLYRMKLYQKNNVLTWLCGVRYPMHVFVICEKNIYYHCMFVMVWRVGRVINFLNWRWWINKRRCIFLGKKSLYFNKMKQELSYFYK